MEPPSETRENETERGAPPPDLTEFMTIEERQQLAADEEVALSLAKEQEALSEAMAARARRELLQQHEQHRRNGGEHGNNNNPFDEEGDPTDYEDEEDEEDEEEEEEANYARQQEERRKMVQPSPPTKVDPVFSVKPLYDRIVSTFMSLTGAGTSSASTASKKQPLTKEEMERRRKMVEAFRSRRDRQIATVFKTIEISLPEGIAPATVLRVKTPDGSTAKFEVGKYHSPGDAVVIPFDGEPLVPSWGGTTPTPVDEETRMRALISFYRFKPREIEARAEIVFGSKPLEGCELVEREEGVFVVSSVMALRSSNVVVSQGVRAHREGEGEDEDDSNPDNRLRGGDLIVQIDSQPVGSLAEVSEVLARRELGSFVPVRALRRGKSLCRCALGHAMIKDAKEGLAECSRCGRAWGRFTCDGRECDYQLCLRCHEEVYAASRALHPVPVNNPTQPYEVDYDQPELKYSLEDVGRDVLVFFWLSADWMRGQIYDYTPDRGHLVMYENDKGQAQAQEHVPDFEVRNYILLKREDEPLMPSGNEQQNVSNDAEVTAHTSEGESPHPSLTVVTDDVTQTNPFDEETKPSAGDDQQRQKEEEEEEVGGDVVVLSSEEADLLKELQGMVAPRSTDDGSAQ